MRFFLIDNIITICLTMSHRNVAWDGIARQAPATSGARFPIKGDHVHLPKGKEARPKSVEVAVK